MISLIRTSIKLFLLFFLSLAVMSCFAGTGSVKPLIKKAIPSKHILKLDSILAARVTIISTHKVSSVSSEISSTSSGRICSCQILNLESANYDHRYMVLLAEKTNDGSSSVYKLAKNRIQKEKKQLKKLFYDKVEVVDEIQGTGSCKSMFYQLSSANGNLKLYEILNADIN